MKIVYMGLSDRVGYSVAIVLVLAIAAYSFLYFQKVKRAIKLSLAAPNQTGDYSLGSRRKPRLRVLLLGDSIAAGTGIEKFENSVGGMLAVKLSEKYQVFLSNRAKLGNRVSNIARDGVTGDWDLAIIIAGSNELIRRRKNEDFEGSLDQLLKKLSAHADSIVLVGPGDVASAGIFPLWIRLIMRRNQWQMAKKMTSVARLRGVEYANPLERPNSKGYFSTDGLHPNALGNKVWFEIIWDKIKHQFE